MSYGQPRIWRVLISRAWAALRRRVNSYTYKEQHLDTVTCDQGQGLQCVGHHYLLELYGCPPDILNDAATIDAALRECARIGRLNIIQIFVHGFAPHGITAVALLKESHLALHTWPELEYVGADLFTCGHESRPDEVCSFLIDYFRALRYSVRRFTREAVVGVGRGEIRPIEY